MGDSSDSFKLGALLILMGGGALIQGIRRIRTMAKIRDTPCSTLRSAPQGLVELQGHALPWKNEYPSLLGRPTVCRQFMIQERVKKGKSSEWVTRWSEAQGTGFIFSDGTGIAKVYLEGAEVQWDELTFPWRGLPEHTRGEVLQRYGISVPGLAASGGFFGIRNFRLVERLIAVGSPVYIRGTIRATDRHEPHVLSPRHQRFLGNVAAFQRDPAARKRFFDVNQDQRIDEHELVMGSVRMLQQAELSVRAGDVEERVRVEGVLQHSPEHGLLIAPHHEEHLLEKLAKWNLLRIVGGALAVAAGLGVLAGTFGWV